jgi:putative acetyltransferase
VIRRETYADIAAVRNLNLAAFRQAAEANLIDALRNSSDTVLSLVAEDNGGISGHTVFSKLQTPDKCLALAPVSVAPESQNKGIGSKLIEERLSQARRDGWRAAFVLSEPNFYTRFGFSAKKADKLEKPYPKKYFMVLELVEDALD